MKLQSEAVRVGARASLLTLLLVGALSACGSDSDAGGSTLDKVQKAKSIDVGIANEQPYAYEEDGQPQGLVVDILEGLLDPLGITEIKPQTGSFDSTIPGLVAERFDLIGAGTYIKPDRCEAVAFTNPIYRVGGAFIVKAGNPKDLHSLGDVAADPEAKIASQTGSSQVQEMADAGIDDSRVSLFSTDRQAVAALQADRVDAVYFPSIQVSTLLKTTDDPDLERAEPYEQIQDAEGNPVFNYGSVPVRKDDDDLREALNDALADMQADGSLLEIYEAWGLTEGELPEPGITADDVCG